MSRTDVKVVFDAQPENFAQPRPSRRRFASSFIDEANQSAYYRIRHRCVCLSRWDPIGERQRGPEKVLCINQCPLKVIGR